MIAGTICCERNVNAPEYVAFLCPVSDVDAWFLVLRSNSPQDGPIIIKKDAQARNNIKEQRLYNEDRRTSIFSIRTWLMALCEPFHQVNISQQRTDLIDWLNKPDDSPKPTKGTAYSMFVAQSDGKRQNYPRVVLQMTPAHQGRALFVHITTNKERGIVIPKDKKERRAAFEREGLLPFRNKKTNRLEMRPLLGCIKFSKLFGDKVPGLPKKNSNPRMRESWLEANIVPKMVAHLT